MKRNAYRPVGYPVCGASTWYRRVVLWQVPTNRKRDNASRPYVVTRCVVNIRIEDVVQVAG